MTRFSIRVSLLALVLTCAVASLFAAPQLRLRMPANNPFSRAVWIPSGSNGPTTLQFFAYNAGDGALDVQASGSAPWLMPAVDAAAPCPFDGALTCRNVRVLFQSGNLADGTYEANVVVTATDAIDAPQTVSVKIYVGGHVPSEIHLYVPPSDGASDFVQFQTPGQQGMPPTGVAPAGAFLSVSASHNGSFREVYDHRVTGAYQGGGVGDQAGTVAVSGSAFAADNGVVPVTLHVTNGPIGQLSTNRVLVQAAEGAAGPDGFVSVSNRGSGTLTISSVDIATDDGGGWLSTVDAGNNSYLVRPLLDGLAAGLYQGDLTINSNAANSPHRVRVELLAAARSGPVAFYRGTVNGANFQSSRPLAPGVIASAFGSQLADAIGAPVSLPLPSDLGGVKVLIDGIEAPLFFVSYGQVNFQVPYEVGFGEKILQIMRDGQVGNQISVQIDLFSAGIFRLGIGEYGAIQNASQGDNFPMPVALGQQFNIPAAPARPGDVLVIFATGLGPLDRAVASGAGAPGAEPLARAVVIPKVRFSENLLTFGIDPQFVGLSPGFVGLFQVNVAIPFSAAPNARTPLFLDVPTRGLSNRVEIAIQ